MATDVITLTGPLAEEELAGIDAFSAAGDRTLEELGAFLQERFSLELTLDPDIVIGFVADSSNLPGKASALCRPATQRDCAVIFRCCFALGIPYTISAGRSNLTGSATPQEGVIISTVKMLAPEVAVDAEAMTARAPVGMILEEMREAVIAQSGGKLHFPVDPTSRGDAAIGGVIACNASGFVPGEAGAARGWIESLDLMLPDGMCVSAAKGEYVSDGGRFILEGGAATGLPVPSYARPTIKNAGGPFSAPDGKMDLVDLVIGSEGLFGMVTGCTVKLAPKPADYLDLFFSLPTEADARAFFGHLREHLADDLGAMSAVEYFGPNCRKYMDHEERLFRGDDQVAIYLQAPVTEGDVEDAAEEWLEVIIGADCNVDDEAILLLDNDRDRSVFMEARHSLPANSLEVVQHRGTYTIMTDAAVPAENFSEFLEFAGSTITEEGMDWLSFGHLGDCHLHFQVLPQKNELDRAVGVYDRIIAKAAELGGVYSGEHGTGKRKRKDFVLCYGEDAVEDVRRCKAAVDPKFLLNRGNVVEPPQ